MVPCLLIFFQGNLNELLTQLFKTHSYSLRLLGKQAGGSHSRKGIGFQTEDLIVLIQQKICAGVGVKPQHPGHFTAKRCIRTVTSSGISAGQVSTALPALYLFL